MGYFDPLKRDVEWLVNWADLRHEQGRREVERDLRRLRREVAALVRKYERLAPAPAVVANEPNDLAAIRAARKAGRRKLWDRFDPKAYAERVKGAYLARAAGCTLGAIVEGSQIKYMESLARHCTMDFPPTDFWTFVNNPWAARYNLSRCDEYLRQNLRHVPVDDDVTYTLLGLLILEDFGPDFTTADVGAAWLKYLPMACTAEHWALENLKAGVSWKRAALKNNPFVEWIGADIRSDPWGYAAPGWPEKAAELAYRDAYLSHRNNGIYGAMYFSAAIAAAFAVDDPLEACRIAAGEIPARCRLRADVTWALRQARRVSDYRHGRRLVDERFDGMSPVHTNNNACLTIFGLALGGRDVTKVIGNTVAMGMDNDCTAATAGSIVGAVVGAAGVPEHWTRPFRNRTRSYINGHEWFAHADLVRRFARAARAVWASA